MSSKTVTTNNIDINNIENALTTRPITARATSAKSSNRSQSAKGRPVIHEPCSSTLGKFHDGVNYSLLNDSQLKRGSTPRSNHPILEAKQKYKYMLTTKSYVDETLFGGTTPRHHDYPNYGNQRDIYENTGNHLTHDLMSNLAPLQIRPPLKTNRSDLNSARIDSARSRVEADLKDDTIIKSKPEPKPWKP